MTDDNTAGRNNHARGIIDHPTANRDGRAGRTAHHH